MAMVDVGGKNITVRVAEAEATVCMKPEVILALRDQQIPKGDVLAAARVAGILAAKRTPDLIPLCHPIGIDSAAIDFSVEDTRVHIACSITGQARTGFEMEALTAVSIAALTIYDMCKPLDKSIEITQVRLVRKSGGKSGDYAREDGES